MTPPADASAEDADDADADGEDARDGAVPVPRGPAAPRLLTALMGAYWYDCPEPIPTGALVALLGEFGVRADATRAALARLRRDGVLEARRAGRQSTHRLAPAARARAATLARAMLGFGAAPVPWDGTWTCVAFSVPESARARRPALRHRLRRLGLAPRHDGVWVTPHDRADRIGKALDELGVEDATILRVAAVARAPAGGLAGAWDLSGLRAGYAGLAADLDEVLPRVEAGAVGPAEALRVRTEVIDRWRSLVSADPALPDALLPAGWPLADARRRFVAAHDALGPLAVVRVRQLVDGHAGAPVPPPRHHGVAGVLAGHVTPERPMGSPFVTRRR